MGKKSIKKELVKEFVEVVYDCGYEKAKEDMLKELKYIRTYSTTEADVLARVRHIAKMLKRSDLKK